jgi:hypothetical protein
MVLKSVLKGFAQAEGAKGTFEMLRSKVKKTVFTVHFTDAKVNAQGWMDPESKFANAALEVFMMAQMFRMVGATAGPDRQPRADWPKRIQAVMAESAWKRTAFIFPAAACSYTVGDASLKPAPLCELCNALYPGHESLKSKLLSEVTEAIKKFPAAARDDFGIDQHWESTTLALGGPYTCSGEMQQCSGLPPASCTAYPRSVCPFQN